MITQLELEYFKCFRLLRLPLGSLTLLSGTNASGKSTVLQSLVLLQQTMRTNEWSTRLLLNGNTINFGTVFDALHYEGRDRFGMGLVNNSISCHWTLEGERREMSLAVQSVRVGDQVDISPATLRHLLPPNSEPAAVAMLDAIRSLNYISAERVGPREVYPLHDLHQGPTVGPAGEHAVSVLFRAQENQEDLTVSELLLPGVSPKLRAQVVARLGMFFPEGTALGVTLVPNTNAVTLGIRTQPETELLRPVHVGFGITQVLPIIVSILAAPPGSIHLIENPEVHLHPAGQALMGRFLAEAAQAGHQLLVETHSDHVLNGIRRSVKDQELKAEQVVIHFFQSQVEDEAQVLSVTLDSVGNLDVWPEGFFDQFDKDMNYFAGWA